jgi:ribosomal protein S18 acetylase RimI-like enzyme
LGRKVRKLEEVHLDLHFQAEMDDPILFNPKTHSHLIPSFADILTACITTPPYTTAGFLPPIDPARIRKWWEDRVREESEGHRKIIMQMARDPSTGEEELAGYVMLGMPVTETGPFRGSVEKLMVSPKYRQKGIAGRLMAKLEEVARAEGRTLLVSLLEMRGRTRG